MSNILKFPTPARVEPTTPDGWKKALTDAGEAVVLAQMQGGDVRKAKMEYDAIEARLPAEVREALASRVSHGDLIRLLDRGWDFIEAVLKIKARF
jgi:hypothetical protein